MTKLPGAERSIARLIWLPFVGAFIAALAASLASSSLGASYTSTALVLLHNTTAQPSAGADLGLDLNPQRIVANNIEVIESRAVLDSVVEETGFSTVEVVRDRFVAVPASPNSDVLEIRADGSNREDAQDLAQAIVGAFVAFHQESEIQALSAEIDAITGELDRLTAQLESDLDSSRAEITLNRVNELSSQRLNLQLQLELADGGVLVIDSGELPADRTRSVLRDALFGAFLGLVIGVGAAVLVLRWPRRPRHGGEPVPENRI